MNDLVNNFNGKIINPRTKFKYEKNNNKLFFYFEAYDSSLISYSDKDNDELWRDDVVEVFLDLGDEFYYEFEVAPNGAVFVATINNRKITFIENNFFTASSLIEGNAYKVKMTIDLNKLGNPKEIKFNAFRVEVKENNGPQILEALNPTLCETFHVREKFIKLV